jgi:hypothetical protein
MFYYFWSNLWQKGVFQQLFFVISWKYCHRCTQKSEVQVIGTRQDSSQKDKCCIHSLLRSRYDRLYENSEGNKMISFCRQSQTRTLSWDTHLTLWCSSFELASHFFMKRREKSWIHSPRFCEIRYFYSFTENILKVQWLFIYLFFFTTSACLLIMQRLILVSGTVLFNTSYKLTMFSCHWLCTISADISVFVLW